jgi:drug/metabolite transporter (DMT)-like permease
MRQTHKWLQRKQAKKKNVPASIAAIIVATALWGTSGGAISGVRANGFAIAAVVELTTGIFLTVLARARGYGLHTVARDMGRYLPALAVIEAANVALYYVALQKAAVGPVIALHLTAPVILLLVDMFRGKRKLSVLNAGAVLLICLAVAAIAVTDSAGKPGNGVPEGLVLSLASAVCIALFVSLVHRVTSQSPTAPAAGLQMLCSGLLLSPALVSLQLPALDVLRLILIAVLLFLPACWLYWWALRTLSAITVGTIQLAEPVSGSVTAFWLYETIPTTTQAVAVVLIATASYVELSADLRSKGLYS